jgi:hypothetical protein
MTKQIQDDRRRYAAGFLVKNRAESGNDYREAFIYSVQTCRLGI